MYVFYIYFLVRIYVYIVLCDSLNLKFSFSNYYAECYHAIGADIETPIDTSGFSCVCSGRLKFA